MTEPKSSEAVFSDGLAKDGDGSREGGEVWTRRFDGWVGSVHEKS